MKQTYLILTTLAACLPGYGQDCKTQAANGFDAWLNCRIGEVVTATLSQRDPNRQTQSPALARSSGSLVDHSSGSDLISTALNLVGINSGNSSNTSGTVTASLYAVGAALNRHDPLDPVYYNAHRGLRSVLLTAGSDSSGVPAADPTAPAKQAKIAGVEILLINKRDLASNLPLKNGIRAALTAATQDYSAISAQVQDLMLKQLSVPANTDQEKLTAITTRMSLAAFPGTLAQLTPANLEEIDTLLRRTSDPVVRLAEVIQAALSAIRQRPLLSILGQGKFHDANGNDTYRSELAFDVGMSDRLSATLNGSFDYLNSRRPGADIRGGHVAGELQYQFTTDNGLTGRKPLMFNLAGDGLWLQNINAAYHAQVKLTIPVFDGVDLPVSFTYANQKGLIKENDVEGKFGFTFDLSAWRRRCANRDPGPPAIPKALNFPTLYNSVHVRSSRAHSNSATRALHLPPRRRSDRHRWQARRAILAACSEIHPVRRHRDRPARLVRHPRRSPVGRRTPLLRLLDRRDRRVGHDDQT